MPSQDQGRDDADTTDDLLAFVENKFYPDVVDYFRYELEATKILLYCNVIIPGLFQTEQFIRSLYAVLPRYFHAQINEDDFVKTRIMRQWRAFERPDPLEMQVVIGEEALVRTVGDQQVIYEQLLHLVEMADLPHIDLRILPASAEFQFVTYNSPDITIFNFQDRSQKKIVSFERGTVHRNSDNEYEVGGYTADFLELYKLAIGRDASRQFLQDVAHKLLGGIDGTQ
jgi:hypothetical protein